MKDKILKLRAEGKTYDQIKAELGCSKSTISYHCGDGQKEKTNNRARLSKTRVKGVIHKKISNYIGRKTKLMIRNFRRSGVGSVVMDEDFTYDLAYAKIVDAGECYLSGRKIDLTDSKTYNLDHIIPVHRGGKNTIDNMGLTCKDANFSKCYLTLDEYLDLCKDVLINFGYEVNGPVAQRK